MTVRWGRAYRGRVWHLLGPEYPGTPAMAICERSDPITEHTLDLPPMGSSVCPRCESGVQSMSIAIGMARQWLRPTTPPENIGVTIDAPESKL